mmetsp:Transcript_4596/g.11153  ORF Transcript_4596/g.11153 Transcript_4596/m.11153 type:complete len:84 (+) Transcript_4596:120-371(+)
MGFVVRDEETFDSLLLRGHGISTGTGTGTVLATLFLIRFAYHEFVCGSESSDLRIATPQILYLRIKHRIMATSMTRFGTETAT